jgi:hypothetical protein
MRWSALAMRESWTVADVRSYLQANSSVNDAKALQLEQMLPANWRKLIYCKGRARVFNCIRLGMTIGGAQYELNSKPFLAKLR